MKPSNVSILMVTLACMIMTGCGFRTYKPSELSTSSKTIESCALTKYVGVFGYKTDKSIILIDPSVKGDVKYLNAVVKKGRQTLSEGSVINIISLSSGWDSDVGSYIVAKARVPSLGGRVVRIRRYYTLGHTATQEDFKDFIEKDFVPCK